MQLTKEEYSRIFKKYVAGEASPEEALFVERYYAAFDMEAEYTASISEAKRSLLEARMKQRIDDRIFEVSNLQKAKSKAKPWLKYAGLFIFCSLLAISAFYLFRTQSEEIKFAQRSTIEPIVERPTLKLANGKIIDLTSANADQTLHDADGISIRCRDGDELVYTSKGSATDIAEFNELTIPKGKQFKITLPDGTKVWLNTASTLRYPVAFASNERKVFLTGEAYFDVAPDKRRPFLVQSKATEIRVIGTEFNVAAYPEDTAVRTTLVKGGVVVSCQQQEVQLEPGEQVFSNQGSIPMQKKKIDLEVTTAWKDGFFVFDQPLGEVTQMLSRWYDLQIAMDGDLSQKQVVGRFSKKRDYRSILSYLGQIGGFSYKIKDNQVSLIKQHN